jgi:hypothetical protein
MAFIPENISFRLCCKECGHIVNGQDYLESMIDLSDHLEKTEHTKFDLEIFDFELSIVSETVGIIKSFEEIDDAITISDLESKLKKTNPGIYGGIAIKNAIKNKLLDIEDIIGNDVYVALTDEGENLWQIYYKKK